MERVHSFHHIAVHLALSPLVPLADSIAQLLSSLLVRCTLNNSFLTMAWGDAMKEREKIVGGNMREEITEMEEGNKRDGGRE